MERKKSGDVRPPGLSAEPPASRYASSDRLYEDLSVGDAVAKLRSRENQTLARGAYELRCLALKGEDMGPALLPIASTLRSLLAGGAAPSLKQSMAVLKEGSSARVHLSECVMLSAKNGADISEALSVMPSALECQDIHVRNFSILALGYHARNGGDVQLYIEIVAKHLSEPMPMNREAALWMLKEAASKGKLQAHQVLLSLGNSREDDPNMAELRSRCHEVLGAG